MALVDDRALEWNVPSPRLRVLCRYEVATGTLVAIVVAAAAALVAARSAHLPGRGPGDGAVRPPLGERSPPGRAPMAGLRGEWQRLHPLSPLVRAGRGAIALFVVIVIPLLGRQKGWSNDLIHFSVLILVLA